ncbi:MAG: ATPase, T2SS/T4P/T4SS family [Candidatus Pacearchaeota archaeon]|nr:ATPase, T2SS/T4P/T4SS family [Candidatus Pacearchaeota archaeon]
MKNKRIIKRSQKSIAHSHKTKHRIFHRIPVPLPLPTKENPTDLKEEKAEIVDAGSEVTPTITGSSPEDEPVASPYLQQNHEEVAKRYGLPGPVIKKLHLDAKSEDYTEKETKERISLSDSRERAIQAKQQQESSGETPKMLTGKEMVEQMVNYIKDGTILEEYRVNANQVNVKVSIASTSEGKFYFLKIPELSIPTKALLDTVRQKLVAAIEVNFEITDVNAIDKLTRNLKERAEIILKQQFHLPEENINLLSGILINEMIGLGNIELLVADPNLEEIVVTSATESVRVYHKKYGWLITNVLLESEKQIENYSAIIARRVGRQITTLTPMLDAHLITGDRVNSILYPICTKGNTITIRKFAREPWTAIDFINNKTCSLDVFALIWTAMQYELNILFSGGTASGKTTILNVSSLFLPPYHRVISIEDTRELQLPEHLYWTPLVTRMPNPEGKGAVTMLDLLVNSLRMRPDRIILGEMRRQEEAEVLFEAMHTGHSVYATVHADSAAETISRLVNPPINVPSNLLKAVHLCVTMFRDRRRGMRRTYQVAEFIPDESEKNGVKPNILYRYEPTTDSIIKHGTSIRVFEELSRHTGLSITEINKELENKKQILMGLAKRNIRDMNGVATAVKKYYLEQGVLNSSTKLKQRKN